MDLNKRMFRLIAYEYALQTLIEYDETRRHTNNYICRFLRYANPDMQDETFGNLPRLFPEFFIYKTRMGRSHFGAPWLCDRAGFEGRKQVLINAINDLCHGQD